MKQKTLLASLLLLLFSFSTVFAQSGDVKEILTITNISSNITDIAFSASDMQIAGSGSDGNITLWDVASGKQTVILKGHQSEVTSVDFSPNGRLLVSGSLDKMTSLWDLTTFDISKPLSGTSGEVYDVAFSPNGRHLANASSDNTVKIWDITTWKLVKTLRSHTDKVRSVAFSYDGSSLASGSDDGKVKIWNVTSGNVEKEISAGGSVVDLQYSRDGSQLAVALSNELKLYNPSTGKTTKILRGLNGTIKSIAFSYADDVIAAAGTDSKIYVWNVSNGNLQKTISAPTGEVNAIAFSKNGKYFACATSQKLIKIWDADFTNEATTEYTTNTGNDQITKPPVLSIQEISLSTSLLDAGESAQLQITIKNNGIGDARDVYAEITCDQPLISFPSRTIFPVIPAKGGIGTATTLVYGELELPEGNATLTIKVVDPVFKVIIPGKSVTFDTREFPAPRLKLQQYAVLEYQSGQPNNKIDLNEIIEVKAAIQNVGIGKARDILIDIENNQPGVLYVGAVDDNNELSTSYPPINQLEVGKYKTVAFRFFINSDFNASSLTFTVAAEERHGKYGFIENISVPINTKLNPEGFVHKVKGERDTDDRVIERIPDFVADISQNIPKTATLNKNGLAVVIGNKEYKKVKDNVIKDYAINDATMMKQYLEQTLGFEDDNILIYQNATFTDLNTLFGSREDYRGLLYKAVQEGITDIFIYYSGMGASDRDTEESYLLPIDGDPSFVSLNGFSLSTFYDNLARLDCNSVTVILDAAFGGANSNYNSSGSIPFMSSVDISTLSKENSTIIFSTTGDQEANPYPEKNHSLFTYYLIKALRGEADTNRDIKLTLGEIKSYLNENVPFTARKLFNNEQIPQVFGDENRIMVKFSNSAMN